MNAVVATAAGKSTVVGIGALELGQRSGSLVTYALGSCLGITVWDPEVAVGGLLHVMMPSSTIAPDKAATNPYMFVDTGVPLMFRRCYELGADKRRMVVKVAGGAAPNATGGHADYFEIGKRNMVQLRKLLWKNGVLIKAEAIGGTTSRTMTLAIATGEVSLKCDGRETLL